MEGLYSFAEAIVETARPALDGGLLAFIVKNIKLPELDNPGVVPQTPNNLDSESLVLADASNTSIKQITENSGKQIELFIKPPQTHFLNTIMEGGYVVALFVGILWGLFLCSILFYTCYRICRKCSRKEKCPAYTSASKVFDLNWCSKAHGCFIGLLLMCVCVAIILGMVTTVRIHTNLATQPYYNASVGLLTPKDMSSTIADPNHLFPNLLYTLSSLRAYILEFIPRTKAATEAPVNELIAATERMQDEQMLSFNDILFDATNISTVFDLARKIGNHSIFLMRLNRKMTDDSKQFMQQNNYLENLIFRLIDKLKEASRFIEDCNNECESVQSLLFNLDVNKTDLLPVNIVAFNFVSRNETPESVQAELDRGERLSAERMEETKLKAAIALDIPGSVRRIVNGQFDDMKPMLTDGAAKMDSLARNIYENIYPRIRSVSTFLLIVGITFWFTIFGQVLLLALTSVKSFVKKGSRGSAAEKVHLFSLILLLLSLVTSTTLFLAGGYASNQVCRYLIPEQSQITLLDSSSGKATRKLALDVHIDQFLSRNWPNISRLGEAMQASQNISDPTPMPRIKSPIHAISEACKDDVGVLEAFDAVKDFDMSVMNKPEMSNRFVKIGRDIMIQSLEEIDVKEMFSKEDESKMEMAKNLDTFLMKETDRSTMIRTVLTLKNGTDSLTRRDIPTQEVKMAWDMFKESYLQPAISPDVLNDLDIRMQKVVSQVDITKRQLDDFMVSVDKLIQVKPIKPTIERLLSTVSELKKLLMDKPRLIKLATDLFKMHIEATTPQNAARLTKKFGPGIMRQVGQCRRLYLAYVSATESVCYGVVSHLNGLWLCIGVAFLFNFISLAFVMTAVGRYQLLGGTNNNQSSGINNNLPTV